MAVASAAFAELASQLADDLRLPDARIAVVPHPIGGTDDATLHAWADAGVDELLRILG